MSSVRSWAVLIRRFLKEESGNAGLQYAFFTACWCACVSGAVYLGTPSVTAKLDAVSAAMHGSPFR